MISQKTENPMQDILSKRVTSLSMMIATVLMVAGPNICLPALPYLVVFFKTSDSILKLSLTITPFVSIGSAFLWSSFYKKRSIKSVSLFILLLFALGSIKCAFASNTQSFFIGRLCQSIGAGGMAVGTLSLINYWFEGVPLSRYLAIYGILFPITFAISPAIGSLLFKNFGFESCFYLLFFLSLIVAILISIKMHSFKIKSEVQTNSFSLLKSKRFILLILCHAMPIGVLQYYVAQSPFLWIKKLNYTMIEFSLIQLIPLSIHFFTTMIYRLIVKKIGIQKCIKIGYLIGGSFFISSLTTLVFMDVIDKNWFLLLLVIFSFSIVWFIVPHITLAMEYGKKFGPALSAQITMCVNIITTASFLLSTMMDATITNILITITFFVFMIIMLSVFANKYTN